LNNEDGITPEGTPMHTSSAPSTSAVNARSGFVPVAVGSGTDSFTAAAGETRSLDRRVLGRTFWAVKP
jgi:hypothetical protein